MSNGPKHLRITVGTDPNGIQIEVGSQDIVQLLPITAARLEFPVGEAPRLHLEVLATSLEVIVAAATVQTHLTDPLDAEGVPSEPSGQPLTTG